MEMALVVCQMGKMREGEEDGREDGMLAVREEEECLGKRDL